MFFPPSTPPGYPFHPTHPTSFLLFSLSSFKNKIHIKNKAKKKKNPTLHPPKNPMEFYCVEFYFWVRGLALFA